VGGTLVIKMSSSSLMLRGLFMVFSYALWMSIPVKECRGHDQAKGWRTPWVAVLPLVASP
jgi:hypothetical protein